MSFDRHEANRLGREIFAADVTKALRQFYGASADVTCSELNTGAMQVAVKFTPAITYHLTVARARQ